ncbi:MAG TPA: SpoIIE family protein phosphatase, partial [Terracidiphilus sp.]|nr:SpoIIE family protein phosphatase [Terracidiphilus sp.]
MAKQDKPWFLRTSTRWTHFRSIPLRHLSVLMIAVFLLFSVIGYFNDLIAMGSLPYAVVFFVAIFSGLNSVLWILVLARLSRVFLLALIAFQFVTGRVINAMANWMVDTFHLQNVPSQQGIEFAASAILVTVILSYVFFIAYIRRQGLESFRMANELALAHGIQKTLVPPVMLRTAAWDIYGLSCPSEKVGGDLVDAIELPGGDSIAYLADIAGHGLQAGILMGMLKTAARTALLDAGEREPAATLPLLLDRLNTVLPVVKEAHMYATFTGLRLGANGVVHYGLAASPPLLQWHAGGRTLSSTEQEQFPLGLLPVSS